MSSVRLCVVRRSLRADHYGSRCPHGDAGPQEPGPSIGSPLNQEQHHDYHLRTVALLAIVAITPVAGCAGTPANLPPAASPQQASASNAGRQV